MRVQARYTGIDSLPTFTGRDSPPEKKVATNSLQTGLQKLNQFASESDKGDREGSIFEFVFSTPWWYTKMAKDASTISYCREKIIRLQMKYNLCHQHDSREQEEK